MIIDVPVHNISWLRTGVFTIFAGDYNRIGNGEKRLNKLNWKSLIFPLLPLLYQDTKIINYIYSNYFIVYEKRNTIN